MPTSNYTETWKPDAATLALIEQTVALIAARTTPQPRTP